MWQLTLNILLEPMLVSIFTKRLKNNANFFFLRENYYPIVRAEVVTNSRYISANFLNRTQCAISTSANADFHTALSGRRDPSLPFSYNKGAFINLYESLFVRLRQRWGILFSLPPVSCWITVYSEARCMFSETRKSRRGVRVTWGMKPGRSSGNTCRAT